jgi:hypothetical protein
LTLSSLSSLFLSHSPLPHKSKTTTTISHPYLRRLSKRSKMAGSSRTSPSRTRRQNVPLAKNLPQRVTLAVPPSALWASTQVSGTSCQLLIRRFVLNAYKSSPVA